MNQPRQMVVQLRLLETDTEQRYKWPRIARVLGVHLHDTIPMLGVIIYPDAIPQEYKILRFRNDEIVNNITNYLGTVTTVSGDVLHYFGGGPGL